MTSSLLFRDPVQARTGNGQQRAQEVGAATYEGKPPAAVRDLLFTLFSPVQSRQQYLSEECYFWRIVPASEILRIYHRFVGVVVVIDANEFALYLRTLQCDPDELRSIPLNQSQVLDGDMRGS